MPRSDPLYHVSRRRNEKNLLSYLWTTSLIRGEGKCVCIFLVWFLLDISRLTRVSYCLQRCAFVDSCLFLFFDAWRLLPYRRCAQTRSVDFEHSTLSPWYWRLLPVDFKTGICLNVGHVDWNKGARVFSIKYPYYFIYTDILLVEDPIHGINATAIRIRDTFYR